MTFVYRCTYRPIFSASNGERVPGKLLVRHVVAENVDEAGAFLKRDHKMLARLESGGVALEMIVMYECAWARLNTGGIIDFSPDQAQSDWITQEEQRDREQALKLLASLQSPANHLEQPKGTQGEEKSACVDPVEPSPTPGGDRGTGEKGGTE